MPQPEGFQSKEHPDFVCKLHKSLYGLKQAPRAWYDRLNLTLCSWGFVNSKVDTSLFTYHLGSVRIWVLVYVNDILITGNNSTSTKEFISRLNSTFALKDLGSISYFLGIEVVRNTQGLHLSQ